MGSVSVSISKCDSGVQGAVDIRIYLETPKDNNVIKEELKNRIKDISRDHKFVIKKLLVAEGFIASLDLLNFISSDLFDIQDVIFNNGFDISIGYNYALMMLALNTSNSVKTGRVTISTLTGLINSKDIDYTNIIYPRKKTTIAYIKSDTLLQLFNFNKHCNLKYLRVVSLPDSLTQPLNKLMVVGYEDFGSLDKPMFYELYNKAIVSFEVISNTYLFGGSINDLLYNINISSFEANKLVSSKDLNRVKVNAGRYKLTVIKKKSKDYIYPVRLVYQKLELTSSKKRILDSGNQALTYFKIH